MFQTLQMWWTQSTAVSKIKEWCGHSLTILWGYLQILVGTIQSLLPTVGDVITDPSVKEAVQTYTMPAWASISMAVLGAVTIAVRLRSLVSK